GGPTMSPCRARRRSAPRRWPPAWRSVPARSWKRETSRRVRVSVMKPLLVLVDLQQDYLKSPQLDPAAGSVVDGAAALLALARSQSVPVAHVWTTVTRDPDNRMAHWKREGLWQCEAGTEGHAPPASLAPRPGEPILHKSAFSAPDVAGFIERLGRDTIVIAGVKTH